MVADMLEKCWILCIVCTMYLQVSSANDEMMETMEITKTLGKIKPRPVTPEIMFSITTGKQLPIIKRLPSFENWVKTKIKRSYKIYDAELIKIAEKMANVVRVSSVICRGYDCETISTSLQGKYQDLLSSVQKSSHLLFKDALSGTSETKTGLLSLNTSKSWNIADLVNRLQEKHKKRVGTMEASLKPILTEMTQYVNKLPGIFKGSIMKANDEQEEEKSKIVPLTDEIKRLNDTASKLKNDITKNHEQLSQFMTDKDIKEKERKELMGKIDKWNVCAQDQRKKGPFYWLLTPSSTGKLALQATHMKSFNAQLKDKQIARYAQLKDKQIALYGNKDFALLYLERHGDTKYKIFNKEKKGVLFCSKRTNSKGQPNVEFSEDPNYEEDGRELWDLNAIKNRVFKIKNQKCNKYLCATSVTDYYGDMVISDCTGEEERIQWRILQEGADEYEMTTTRSPGETCEVEVFEDSYYSGFKDVYDMNTSPLIRDNDMSSLKVPTDCCVTVYADEGYAGESRTFCEDEPWLGTYGWNDKVSSIKIEQNSCPVEDVDYQGNDIRMIPHIDTWRECSDECRKSPNCKYWSWLSNTYGTKSRYKECYIKTSNGGREVETGVISGSRTCGKQEACVATSGKGVGKKCIFPFKYEDKTCKGPKCCNLSNSEKGSWCATEVDEDGWYVGNSHGFCNGTVCDPDYKPKEKKVLQQELPDKSVQQYCGEKVPEHKLKSVIQSKRKIERDISDREGKIENLSIEKKKNTINIQYKNLELANVEKRIAEAKATKNRWLQASEGIQLFSKGFCAIKKYLGSWKGSKPVHDFENTTALIPAPSKRDNIIRCGYSLLAYGIASYDTYQGIHEAKKAAYVENSSSSEREAFVKGSGELLKDAEALLDNYISPGSPCSE